jgi:hypothetical protein
MGKLIDVSRNFPKAPIKQPLFFLIGVELNEYQLIIDTRIDKKF